MKATGNVNKLVFELTIHAHPPNSDSKIARSNMRINKPHQFY